MSARVKLPPELTDLLRSELVLAIEETALHRDDEIIAMDYLVEKSTQMEIAVKLGWERSTVSRHLPYIIERVSKTADKITKHARS